MSSPSERMPFVVEPSGTITQFCSICATEMLAVKCKLLCPNCGAKMDCSDT